MGNQNPKAHTPNPYLKEAPYVGTVYRRGEDRKEVQYHLLNRPLTEEEKSGILACAEVKESTVLWHLRQRILVDENNEPLLYVRLVEIADEIISRVSTRRCDYNLEDLVLNLNKAFSKCGIFAVVHYFGYKPYKKRPHQCGKEPCIPWKCRQYRIFPIELIEE